MVKSQGKTISFKDALDFVLSGNDYDIEELYSDDEDDEIVFDMLSTEGMTDGSKNIDAKGNEKDSGDYFNQETTEGNSKDLPLIPSI